MRFNATILIVEVCRFMGFSTSILYVEDNPENRLLVRRILQAEGFDVLEAGDAVQALEVIKERLPDLILMDINMPDIDGFTLTARLKAMPELHRVPIIALTANVMKGDRERTLDAGCDGYIQKPIDVDNLPFQINRFLAEKR
jgi:two-component system cell cycle response regulator DivK